LKAIVLCGGFGTRLGDLTRKTPKPILPVAGKPFLEHVLDQIILAPIDEIILAVSFEWEKIKLVIGNSWRGVPVTYSIESQPLGTGGAIKLAMTSAQIKEALVFNGDTLLKVNPDELRVFSEKNHADVGIALKVMDDCARYGSVSIDESNRIIEFSEKGNQKAGLINSGVYYLRNSILDQIKQNKFSFENEFLVPMSNRLIFYGMKTEAYFIDMGVPDDFYRAQMELK
jgi:D-glycero-alpha-D-manno-heptose 1-phosphate guanylyltransferase